MRSVDVDVLLEREEWHRERLSDAQKSARESESSRGGGVLGRRSCLENG